MSDLLSNVPSIRIRPANDARVRTGGDFVLYWMIAARRVHWNFALDRAIDWARHLGKPLVVFEPLRAGYPWASDRMHRFVIDGMRDNAEQLAKTSARYFPYVEPKHGDAKGLLEALTDRACVVVTDEFPAFFIPRMIAAVAPRLSVKLEVVDSNGLLPLRAADHAFPLAHSFRRFLQKTLPAHLGESPKANPLTNTKLPKLAQLPTAIARHWKPAADELLAGDEKLFAKIPIDHDVKPTGIDGGAKAAHKALNRFFDSRLAGYTEDRNLPEEQATSGLSPYLHFGHISTHEIFDKLIQREDWSPRQLASKPNGSREGWWNMSPEAEAFLDQVVTWREVGFNMCAHEENYDQYESLPDWAQKTLAKHARDRRVEKYSFDEFTHAETGDQLWNAAQRELVREGRIHNYLRMLWGKKILEWSASPQEALATMIELNNKYALDGRDPNSYSGIFWILGRYDRAWGPERPIFGTVRYMSSANTARKFRVSGYLERYARE